MSLSFEKLGEKTFPIANLYIDNVKEDNIFYTDSDDLPEKFEPLKKIRINEKDKTFFQTVTDFNKTNQTDRIFVSGETGCGKSTYIADYVRKFKEKYPKAHILLFSSKKEDEQLDKIKYIERVNIDEDILVNPYTLNEISVVSKPLLTIFDDIQDFPTKKINQEIARLRDEILRNGRSYGIFSIYVNHDPSDYRNTKSQLFEANKCVIFPKRCGEGAYNYLMDKKLHIGKKQIELINSLKSSFVCINKSVPRTAISDKYILLL